MELSKNVRAFGAAWPTMSAAHGSTEGSMIDQQDYFIDGPAGRLSVRAKGLASRPAHIVVLVQGSNLTGQSMFDLSFPGGEGYSLMDVLVAAGFGAVTFAIRGYGSSELSDDPFTVTTDAAMDDLAAVLDHVAVLGWRRPHLLGFSWGGRIAGRLAESRADEIGRLILYDPARGGPNVVLPAPTERWWENAPELYLEKLEPEFTDRALQQALAARVVAHESRAPNGIRLENATPVIAIAPERIWCPTLMIYGVEAAKAVYMKGGMERGEFFERLATDDKAFVILPGGGDFLHFQRGRWRLHRSILHFLLSGGG
jgi:pimeloyl-ACP methyl ester carboxylesterase